MDMTREVPKDPKDNTVRGSGQANRETVTGAAKQALAIGDALDARAHNGSDGVSAETDTDVVGPSIFTPDAVDTLDCALHANLARLTLGISPVVLAMAFLDWLVHLGISPGKQAQLSEKAVRKAVRLGRYAAKCAANPHTPACIEPLP